MKYLKKFESNKMYDENDIFNYVDKVNLFKIKELINNIPNINLNIKNKVGDTPLIDSIRCGLFKIFELLIDSGADVNVVDEYGKTPLMLAVRNENNDMVDKLLQSPNIDVNLKDYDGETALHICSWYNTKKSFKILKKLIDSGVDWNILDNDGTTFLTYLNYKVKDEILKIYKDKYDFYTNINKYNI